MEAYGMMRITRRKFIGAGLTLAAGAALCSKFPAGFLRRTPPNLVLITSDTTRAKSLALHGCAVQTMPAVEEVGRRSAVFEQAYAVSNITVPSHASMFTGRFPDSHGVIDNWQVLPRSVPTLAEMLADQGYFCAAFLGVSLLNQANGVARGFRHVDWRPSTGHPALQFIRRSADYVENAIAFMNKMARTQQPFFLWFHSFDPHAPYDPPPKYTDMFLDPSVPHFDLTSLIKEELRDIEGLRPDYPRETVLAQYHGELRYWDDNFAKLFSALDEAPDLGNTVVVFISDHGENVGEGDVYGHHYINDEVLHIPFFIYYPDGCLAQRFVTPVQHPDLLPTLLSLLDIPCVVPGIEGIDVSPLLKGKQSEQPDRISYSLNDNYFAACATAPAAKIKVRKMVWTGTSLPPLPPPSADTPLPFRDCILDNDGVWAMDFAEDHVAALYHGQITIDQRIDRILWLRIFHEPAGNLLAELDSLAVVNRSFAKPFVWTRSSLPPPMEQPLPWSLLSWAGPGAPRYAVWLLDEHGETVASSPWISFAIAGASGRIVPWNIDGSPTIHRLPINEELEYGVPYTSELDPNGVLNELDRIIARPTAGAFLRFPPVIRPAGGVLFPPVAHYSNMPPQALLACYLAVRPLPDAAASAEDDEKYEELRRLGYAG